MVFLLYLQALFLRPGTAYAAGLRDVKPPVYFPFNYLPLIIILSLLFIAGTGFLIRHILSLLKKGRAEAACEAGPKDAREKAYEALEALRSKRLLEKGKIKEYYFELSNITRHYIEDRFSLKAPEMTTEEFFDSIRDSDQLSAAQKNLLKDFLNHCDMVKFARYAPSKQEADGVFGSAERFIEETRIIKDDADGGDRR